MKLFLSFKNYRLTAQHHEHIATGPVYGQRHQHIHNPCLYIVLCGKSLLRNLLRRVFHIYGAGAISVLLLRNFDIRGDEQPYVRHIFQ